MAVKVDFKIEIDECSFQDAFVDSDRDLCLKDQAYILLPEIPHFVRWLIETYNLQVTETTTIKEENESS